MKKLLFFVALVAIIAACNPYGSQIPKSLIGNYHSLDNGEWLYGLYEEFAIYQNDFWNYESATDNQIVLVHQSGKKLTIDISKSDDLVLNVIDEQTTVPTYTFNGKKVANYINSSSLVYRFISPIYLQTAAKVKDTTSFKKHKYSIDTAVVRLYIRNTALGLYAFQKRIKNRPQNPFVFTYIDNKYYEGYPINSTDHYGYCYEYKIPLMGVGEIAMSTLFSVNFISTNNDSELDYFINDFNYIVEPGDTLMFMLVEDRISKSMYNVFGGTDVGGSNWRFNAEKNATVGVQEMPGYLEFTITENGKSYPKKEYRDSIIFNQEDTLSKKFVEMWRIKNTGYNIVDNINEDEIFNSVKLFRQLDKFLIDTLPDIPSTPETLQQHPDYIVAKNSTNNPSLIDPAGIEKFGLSDDFIEFYRLAKAVQRYNLEDYEYQSVMQNIKNDGYKKYLISKRSEKKYGELDF